MELNLNGLRAKRAGLFSISGSNWELHFFPRKAHRCSGYSACYDWFKPIYYRGFGRWLLFAWQPNDH